MDCMDYLSEDWALCKRALDKGQPVYTSSGPVCGHVGPHVYSLEDAHAQHTEVAARMALEREERLKEIEKQCHQ